MALTHSKASTPGSPLPEFDLPGTDGQRWKPADFQGKKALLVIFMCNHCPYVVAVQDRIVALSRNLGPRGLAVVGINSNDTTRYPADSFEAMKVRAQEKAYDFPYLWDETQGVARAFDAACTPDPYLYENTPQGFVLRHRGRIDDALAAGIDALLSGQPLPAPLTPSMGCSIKWKN